MHRKCCSVSQISGAHNSLIWLPSGCQIIVKKLEAASVTDLYTCEGSVWLRLGSLPRQFYMQGSRIDEMHFITLFCQPAGVHARTTTYIENHRRKGGHIPHHQFLGPRQLNLTRAAL